MLTTRSLTIMFTDIVGYAARAAVQSRAEHVALLQQHDRLLRPLIRQFGGTLVKSMGDGLLVTFRSSTMALRCAMAMQDALAGANGDQSEQDALHIRIALASGDVQLQNHDVFGEAVNIASRIESITPPDQIYFASSVYLAMNKAEISAELMASHELKGIPFPVEIYRVLPQGKDGRFHAVDDLTSEQNQEPNQDWREALATGRWSLWALAAVLVLAATVFAWLVPGGVVPSDKADVAQSDEPTTVVQSTTAPTAIDPDARLHKIESLLAQGQVDQAQQALSDVLAANESSATILLSQGHLAFATKHRETGADAYRKALELVPELADNPLLVDNLVGALGWETKLARELLEQYASKTMIDALATRTAQPGYWGRWHATAVLEAVGRSDRIKRVDAALLDLQEGENCEKRRTAIARLGALKDKRALPVLQPLADMPLFTRITSDDACLVEAAQAAVAQIEGSSPG